MRVKEKELEVFWEGGQFRMHATISYEPSQVFANGPEPGYVACQIDGPYSMRYDQPEFVELKTWEFDTCVKSGLGEAIGDTVNQWVNQDFKDYMEGR